MAFGSDYLFLIPLLAILTIVLIVLAYTGTQLIPVLNTIPGFNAPFTPKISSGVICQTANQVYLNQNNLTVNSVQTVNTICTINYVSQAPSNSVSWISALSATESILNDYQAFDQYIPFIFIIVSLGVIIAAALLPSHPVVIAMTFVIMLVTLILAFLVSNAMHAFLGSPIFANVVGSYPDVLALWANLGLWEFGFFLIYIMVIAMRSKGGTGGGGGQGMRQAVL